MYWYEKWEEKYVYSFYVIDDIVVWYSLLWCLCPVVCNDMFIHSIVYWWYNVWCLMMRSIRIDYNYSDDMMMMILLIVYDDDMYFDCILILLFYYSMMEIWYIDRRENRHILYSYMIWWIWYMKYYSYLICLCDGDVIPFILLDCDEVMMMCHWCSVCSCWCSSFSDIWWYYSR